jgi:hypothetical protein
MSGSGASNLGYGKFAPLSNIDGSVVNVNNSNNPANFSSNETQQQFGLFGTKSNVDAAAGMAPGICLFKGGAKKLKKKIKNITKIYKNMKNGSKKIKALKRKIRSRMASRNIAGGKRKTRRHKYSRKYRGGYSQYQNNQPFSMGYSTGGVLSAGNLALANPVPFKPYNDAIDNLNAYTMKGFPSKGH